MIPSFKEFIEQKSLYYKEIDTDIVKEAYNQLSPHISHPLAIHLIGTNAKGSTGRAIAHLAYKSGKSVGHYSSPHIVRFNERLWLNGKDASDTQIEDAHKKLYSILDRYILDRLSYFEYTTLLAFVLFEKCDLIVLEAGLGGEFDATTLYQNRVLTLITPIGIDHQAFLGSTIEEITSTKLRAMSRRVVLSPQPYKEVYEIAKILAQSRGSLIEDIDIDRYLNDDRFLQIMRQKGYPKYLQQNIAVAMSVADLMGIEYEIEDLDSLRLFGRYYPLADNIYIDVGHNELAASAIYEAIANDTVLIYNTLDDKDYKTILQILSPKLKRVEIIKIDTPRAVDIDRLKATLDTLNIAYSEFEGKIDESENYLVFGSFYTVESFLEIMEKK